MISRPGAENPYTNMLSTLDPAHFYGREALARSIIEGLKRSNPESYIIRGFKAVGKTSLWRYIVRLERDSRGFASVPVTPVFIHVDFYQPGPGADWNLAQVCEAIYAQMAANPEMPNGLDLGASRADHPPDSTWPHRLTELALAARLKKHLPVICLDHFDRVVQGMKRDVEGSLIRLKNNASLIMLLEKDPVTLLGRREIDSPLFQQMAPKTLRILTRQDAEMLIKQPAADAGVTIPEDESRFLLERAGRHPYLLTLACEWLFHVHEVFGRAGEASAASVLAAQPWLRSTLDEQDRIQEILYVFWNRLSDDERRVLHAIACDAFAPVDRAPQTREDRYALKGLFDKELIETNEGAYCVSFGLLKDHATRVGLRKMRRPLDTDELKNRLARQECELFTYLLEHDGDVCATTDLYERFWGGKANQAALAASISRIRSAIREDFDSEWDYVPNVRGRGYRFTRPPSSA
jgi:hypothetical protein